MSGAFHIAGCGWYRQVLVFDVTLRSFQQMLRERATNELCLCYRKIVRRAAKQGMVWSGVCEYARAPARAAASLLMHVAPIEKRKTYLPLPSRKTRVAHEGSRVQRIFFYLFAILSPPDILCRVRQSPQHLRMDIYDPTTTVAPPPHRPSCSISRARSVCGVDAHRCLRARRG